MQIYKKNVNFVLDLLPKGNDNMESFMDGRYRILRKLGEGTYGEVFLTEHTGLGVLRAIKRIKKDHDRLHTGRNEVDILKNLHFSGIPIIYDIWEDEEYLFIVEEYVNGITLAEYITGNKVNEKEIISITVSICEILKVMQEKGGICHLDLKPENIIIDNGNVRLLDFGSGISQGFALSKNDYNTPKKGLSHFVIMGTKGYAAPESYTGLYADAAQDIYSLGKIMIFMIMKGKNAATLDEVNCSNNLKEIIAGCICHDRANRITSYEEIISLLNQSKKINNRSKKIYVFGSMDRIGTTHFAIMLTVYLNQKRVRAGLCTRKNDVPLYLNHGSLIHHHGVYKVDGCTVIPDYCGYAVADIPESITLVKDMGTFCEESFALLESLKSDENNAVTVILVGGHTLREMLEYERVASLLKKQGIKYITALNFCGAKEFVRLKNEHHIKGIVNIPFCPDPYRFVGGKEFDKILGTL